MAALSIQKSSKPLLDNYAHDVGTDFAPDRNRAFAAPLDSKLEDKSEELVSEKHQESVEDEKSTSGEDIAVEGVHRLKFSIFNILGFGRANREQCKYFFFFFNILLYLSVQIKYQSQLQL